MWPLAFWFGLGTRSAGVNVRVNASTGPPSPASVPAPSYGSVMDYFEIFLQRMILCRKAAERLGLQFKLIINEQQLI